MACSCAGRVRQPKGNLSAIRSVRALLLAGVLAGSLAGHADAAIPDDEKAVLQDLYVATGGADWAINTGWMDAGVDACAWHGVTCDALHTHVTGISLGFNHLVGSLPVELRNLTKLQTVDVAFNQLSGSIPALTGLAELKDFSAYGNQFSGAIPSLAGLTSLTSFYVYGNQMNGPIPSLAGLTNLQVFVVLGNQLTGSIPPLNGLTSLAIFEAPDNRLSGSIPALTGLTNLQIFDVDANQLGGAIPSLAGLTSLKHFAVSDNRLTGPVPPAPMSLSPQGSILCPNPLQLVDDPDWDIATGESPWWRECDPVFANGFE